MNILLSGATGLIGRALTEYLTSKGHTIYPLFRNPASKKSHYWSPEKNQIHLDDGINLDAVIHLAGENIADSRWSNKKKAAILNSRVDGTRLISKEIASLKNRPRLFISASAIGFYGDTGDDIVDEDSNRGTGFLSDVATQWEMSTRAAEEAGIRTIHIRTGIVLSPDGGVLQKMLLPFKMGFGGVVGNGKQYMSWISINDVIRVIEFLIDDTSLSGPFNLVAPQPVTNFTFTRSLGRTLHRPTFIPLPAMVARIMFGEMADALLLSSCRVEARRLQTSGYTFLDSDLDNTLAGLLEINGV